MLVLRMPENERNFQTTQDWFSLHTTVKTQVKAILEMSKGQDPGIIGTYLVSLPGDFRELHEDLRRRMYGDCGEPVPPRNLGMVM